MTLQQIKQAIDEGKVVYWSNLSYKVIFSNNDYYIVGHSHKIGLTWADNITLNGKEEEFFT